jgi:predicted extracellular nuclease
MRSNSLFHYAPSIHSSAITSFLLKQPRRRVLSFCLALVALAVFAISLLTPTSSALTNNGTITTFDVPLIENFDSLASTGTGIAWTDNSTIPGWYSTRATYNSGTGSSNAGALYSFGVEGTNPVTDRALGGIASGTTGTFYWGARFVNNTGNTITSLEVSYIGEQWRNGGSSSADPGVAQTMNFQYQVANAGVITGANAPATGWSDYNPLNFTSPIFGTVLGTALDGNFPVNRLVVASTIPLTVAPGQEVWLRWSDQNDANNDHGLAVDDLVVIAHGGGGINLSINDVSVPEGDGGPTTASFTVTLSAPAPAGGVTFDIATADGSVGSPATVANNDYVSKALSGQTILQGNTTYTFDVTINGDTDFEPNENFVVNVTGVTGTSVSVSDSQGVGTIENDDCPPAPGDVVISQVYGGGGNGSAPLQSDFIELFNRGVTPVNLSGWSVQYQSSSGTGTWQVTTLSGSIAPGGYYLIKEGTGTGCSGSPCGAPLPTADATGTIAMAAGAGKVALSSSTTPFAGSCASCAVDMVGYGGASCFEGTGPTGGLSNTTAALRKRGGCFDSNNNNIDFSVSAPNPRNSASPTNSCSALSLAIHDIQGTGATTPYSGQFVSTSGTVTARKNNGFFMQASEADYDLLATTSEGIFVFTSASPAVAVGDSVAVLGTATEFFNLTQLESTLPGDVTVTSTGNTLPAPVVLTTSILDATGTPTQLERFEGMRMHADSLVSVAPTNEFGETFTVLEGVARPIREPGIEFGLAIPPDPTSGTQDCCIPIWDLNPERIMIDSDGLAGATPISVTSNVTFSNVTGPLDFTFDNYKILPETPPAHSANISAVPVPTPAAGELTVAGYNIENFSNNATQRQKAALAIRDVLHLPDIIGTIEIFELSGLEALAAEIEAISGVHYEARLIEADGDDGDADQDVGFLIKTPRVQIDSVTQIEKPGCDGQAANCNTFTDPNTNLQALLNDRPPLVLRATVDATTLNPRQIIVVVNHLRSFIDIELVTGEGPRVRAKRKAQAEFLAGLLQKLQTDNSGIPVVSIGDYNAYQFNDGYTDPIATIKGTPTADDETVVDKSPDIVDPNFVNLTDSLPPDQRYSFIFEGTPQSIDHFIINTVANSYIQRYHIARNNTDFPEVPGSLFANDATRPERNSDHDMPVGYFKFPKAATTTTVSNASAVFSPSDQTVVLSANVTTAAGTVNEGTVTFTVTNVSSAVVGVPVVANVSGGVATANYVLPGGTTPQALTITGNYSGTDVLATSSGNGTLSVSFNICLLYDPTKAVKSGATYPIRIQLCDINGNNVSSPSIVVQAVEVGQISTTADGEVLDSGNANADDNFRFDSGLYIYNLKTTGLTSGIYNLYFTAGDDPVLHAVQFQVK